MKGASSAGLILIILAIFCIWAYNTGRLQAIVHVIRDPSYRPPTTGSSAPHNTVSGGGGGGGGGGGCGGDLAGGTPSIDCIFSSAVTIGSLFGL